MEIRTFLQLVVKSSYVVFLVSCTGILTLFLIGLWTDPRTEEAYFASQITFASLMVYSFLLLLGTRIFHDFLVQKAP